MTEKLSFEDVLDALMLEESAPSYEALMRWSEHYPQYRQALAEFFATWALQKHRPEPEADIDEDRIAQKSVEHAMEILRKQGRLIPKDAMERLEPFDQLVLTAIYLLHGQGYAVNITERVGEMSGTRAMLGSIFISLDRLENKHLVSSREIDAEGKIIRYFTVTLHGERAIARAKETSQVVARFLEDFA